MIKPETIQEIFETALIDEVVGDYVNLRKRGVNLIGLCPFHNEKTPSFTVSPAKGIYKCFGCGKGGNSVNFIMEHEHYSYPDALKHLARKYNIEVEEKEQTPEQMEFVNEQESLYQVSTFAQKYFTEQLLQSEEGKAIGLSYFLNRGFTDQTIEKFAFGYSTENFEGLTKAAIGEGYTMENLVKSGLTIEKDQKHYDRFRGRVIFPIHNLSGRVIAFGGRILNSEKSKAKYVNSPESVIYSKSKVLYGLYQSRNAIIKKDNCLLVEGYTDVTSLHQAGIENVVASSGTSLTIEQIKLIKRFTPNITILYDGDDAGIKASFRGIDMILEEGMNVKIVLFPDGEDPDSYARSHRSAEVEEFIEKSAKDFIAFKTNLLLKDAESDPIKKAGLIKEIVQTISVIPDGIFRSVYVRECSSIMNIPEQTLLNSLNKELRKRYSKNFKTPIADLPDERKEFDQIEKPLDLDVSDTSNQERDIIRLLLLYSNDEIEVVEITEDKQEYKVKIKVAEFIVHDIRNDEVIFHNPEYQFIFNEIANALEKGEILGEQYFTQYHESNISNIAVDLTSTQHTLGNWERHKIVVNTEKDKLKHAVTSSVLSFKARMIKKMILDNQIEIRDAKETDDQIILMQKQMTLKRIESEINSELSRIIIN